MLTSLVWDDSVQLSDELETDFSFRQIWMSLPKSRPCKFGGKVTVLQCEPDSVFDRKRVLKPRLKGSRSQ